jgi:hypothetical protein
MIMLQKRNADFAESVWRTSARLDTLSATRIADDMLGRSFPATLSAAEDEGASTMLRKGVIAAVKDVLASPVSSVAQADFASISSAFAPTVRTLKRPSYFVEARGEYVSVADLIREPVLLNDARGFMRRKGDECLAEADRLDQLYREVTSA